MKLRILILAAIALLPLVSCGNRAVSAQLDDIESYIHERPDSALAILQAIDKQNLTTRSLKAKYAVLYSATLDKNYIDTTDLSIIEPAVSYYRRHGSADEKMRAYFYQGRVHYNRKEDNEAMNSFLLALQDSSRAADNHYKDLVNSAISDIFSRNHNYEQELEYTATALRYARLAGDDVGVWAMTGHLADCYGNVHDRETSDSLYQIYFNLPVYNTNALINHSIAYAKNQLLSSTPNPDKCIEILDGLFQMQDMKFPAEAYWLYAYAKECVGESETADMLISQLDKIDPNAELNVWKYRTYRHQRRYEDALNVLENAVRDQDSVVMQSLSQSLVQVQRDYYSAQNELNTDKVIIQRHRIAIILLVASILVFALLAALYYTRSKARARVEEISFLHLEARHMLDIQKEENQENVKSLQEKQKIIDGLRKQFAVTYKKQYSLLNNLCAAYKTPIVRDRRDYVYDEVKRILEVINSDEVSQRALEAKIDDSLNGIVSKLRHDFPNLPESEYRFMQYIILGLEAKTISNIMGISADTVYTKKKRLKDKLTKLDSPNKELYLDFLT